MLDSLLHVNRLSTECGSLDGLTTLWACTAYYGDSFAFFFNQFPGSAKRKGRRDKRQPLAHSVKEIQLSPSFRRLLNHFAKYALSYVIIYQVCYYNNIDQVITKSFLSE
jgi:hypothetical protein